jgi:FAD binding domain
MVNKERTPITNIVILAVVAVIALTLSILSYQYSILTSNKIIDVASQEVRSNTRIEVHDISQILANKLQTVRALLQTLSESPAIHNNEYKRADIVINTRQRSSSDLTDFYMWLDKNGKINWISNINESIYQKYRGTDLSYRPYFTIPRLVLQIEYSDIDSSYRYLLGISQAETERILQERLARQGVAFEWGVTFIAFAQADRESLLTATLRQSEGRLEEFEPSYLIGAEGREVINGIRLHPYYHDKQ